MNKIRTTYKTWAKHVQLSTVQILAQVSMCHYRLWNDKGF